MLKPFINAIVCGVRGLLGARDTIISYLMQKIAVLCYVIVIRMLNVFLLFFYQFVVQTERCLVQYCCIAAH